MPFPTTGILDTFDRPDEGPPPSASWTTDWYQNAPLKVISNTAGAVSAGDAYWNPTTFGPDSEVYATFATVQIALLGLRLTTPGVFSTNGYMIYGGASFIVYRIDGGGGGVLTQLGALIIPSPPLAAGDGVGFEAIGSTLTVYSRVSGVWSSLGSRIEGTYGTAGFIGAGTDSGTTRLDDFGGGTTVPAVTSTFIPTSARVQFT